jgi:hypothetical protein
VIVNRKPIRYSEISQLTRIAVSRKILSVGHVGRRLWTGAETMTTSKSRKEHMSDIRDAIEEIDADLEGALEELKEIRQRIADLKEDKRWRVEAYRYLKAGGNP